MLLIGDNRTRTCQGMTRRGLLQAGMLSAFGLTLPDVSPERLTGVKPITRRRMAAPAAGSGKVHEVEQARLIEQALAD